MSDENDAPQGGTGGTDNESGYTPPATQADLDRIIADRLSRERARYADYDDLKTKAGEYDKVQDAAKSDLQKANDRAEQLARELATEQAARLRHEAAAKAGLSADLAARLQGTTAEELAADAAALKALLPASQSNAFRDAQGKGGDTKSGDWLRDSLATR